MTDNALKYLAVTHNKNYVAWAYFCGTMLDSTDKLYYNEFKPYKQMFEFYKYFKDVLLKLRISILVVKRLDIRLIKKQDLAYFYKIRGILQMLCAELGIIYSEAKTDGWELYITKGKNTNKRKLELMNNGYETNYTSNDENFKFDDVEVANAIILGEAISRGRLHV